MTRTLCAFVLLTLMGCHKVPLHENRGTFEVLAAHYFESEKTQYIFYSVTGLKAEQARTSWPSLFEIKANDIQSAALKVQADGYASIDFTQSVHKHRLVTCGENRLCGSMSFKAEHAPRNFDVRFKYHEKSSMKIEAAIGNSVHKADSSSSSQSAIVYGVFNDDNGRLQVRVHNNFGYPNDEDLPNFGMERSFEVSKVALENFSMDDENSVKKSSGNALLFPAEICERDSRARLAQLPAASSVAVARISGKEGWWPHRLDPNENQNSACFKTRMLDRNGKALSESWAMARRNPVLQRESLIISSPMKEARKIPLVISYCLDQPDSLNLTSQAFLDYQLFILGAPKSAPGTAIDVCFAVGQEERFGRDLDRVLNEKIAAARRSRSDDKDFLLTVAINHRLSPVIVRFHQMIATALDRKIHEERILVSPRLVGAFVYDSDSLEERGLSGAMAGNSSTIWCPRVLEGEKTGQDPSTANCASFKGGKIDLGPINFLIPMGTFPTLSAYVDYSQKYGDKGLSRNPQLTARALKTNVNTVPGDAGATYTFFDGERVEIEAGQSLRFCTDRDSEGLLSSVVARTVDSTGARKVLTSAQLTGETLGGARDTTVDLGLSWEYPFVGGITFEIPIEGSVFEIIPIQTSTGGAQAIGDMKWTRPSWNIGRVLQKCAKYCDHPFFDEAGIYQAGTTWRTSTNRCPTPKSLQPPSGS